MGTARPCGRRARAIGGVALAGALHAAGVDGLSRDKTRPSRKPSSTGGDRACDRPHRRSAAGETTHWTASAMAKAVEISVSSVQRIGARMAQPHRVRQFSCPTNRFCREAERRRRPGRRPAGIMPSFSRSTRETDSSPPSHPAGPADEEGTRRHHDPRLQASWHDDPVRRARCPGRQGDRPLMPCHRHQEFIRFLAAVEAKVPKRVPITPSSTITPPTSIRTSATGSPVNPAGPSTPPRPLPPGSCGGRLLRQAYSPAAKRGVFRSVAELEAAILRFIDEANDAPEPSSGPPAEEILAAVKRGRQVLELIH